MGIPLGAEVQVSDVKGQRWEGLRHAENKEGGGGKCRGRGASAPRRGRGHVHKVSCQVGKGPAGPLRQQEDISRRRGVAGRKRKDVGGWDELEARDKEAAAMSMLGSEGAQGIREARLRHSDLRQAHRITEGWTPSCRLPALGAGTWKACLRVYCCCCLSAQVFASSQETTVLGPARSQC